VRLVKTVKATVARIVYHSLLIRPVNVGANAAEKEMQDQCQKYSHSEFFRLEIGFEHNPLISKTVAARVAFEAGRKFRWIREICSKSKRTQNHLRTDLLNRPLIMIIPSLRSTIVPTGLENCLARVRVKAAAALAS
jgi:hypothetical protein